MMVKIMNRKGFTLVEVIVVIAIIAILLLVLVPNVFVMIDKNNKKSCNNLKDNIESAAKIYVTNNKYDLGFGCNTPKNITFKTLVDSGDLELNGGTLENPFTGSEVNLDSNYVKVTYDCNNKSFSYEVYGIDCE